jgi:RHS repeat-associated protein
MLLSVESNPMNQNTSKERDAETRLDYFGARYYSGAQGRFTAADPLFIELRRLGDPQQLNLYSYARNNPLRFLDPNGLDVTVTGDYADDYLEYLRRNIGSFDFDLVDGKIQVKGDLKSIRKSLKGKELALFDAFTDPNHHATINTVSGDPMVDFGRYDKAGMNTVDVADLKLLDGPGNTGGPFTANGVAGHETLEAFETSKGWGEVHAHVSIGKHFPGLGGPIRDTLRPLGDPITGDIISSSVEHPVERSREHVRVYKEYVTPIPQNALPTGHIPAHVVNVERVP